ncbi:MAG: hypothetical protein BWX84_01249 [Verrucomicrobia bacterium ADurb.Bin118]|nr:MAG: hypothetical protein BWX84_01249 [Verrucomicrobia bacterium ADurb.Bin118]
MLPAPGQHRAIRAQANVVEVAARNGDQIGRRRRDITLPVSIVAPSHHRAIAAQRQAMLPARRHRHHVADAFGDGVIQSRRHHRPVRAQREVVPLPGRDGDDAAPDMGNLPLAALVVAPGRDRSVRAERQTVFPAGGKADHVGRGRRDVRLPRPAIPPTQHRSILPAGQAVIPPGGNRNDIRGGGRHAGLPRQLFAPGGNGPVVVQDQAVICPGRHSQHIGGGGGRLGLTIRVVPAPYSHDRPLNEDRADRAGDAAPGITDHDLVMDAPGIHQHRKVGRRGIHARQPLALRQPVISQRPFSDRPGEQGRGLAVNHRLPVGHRLQNPRGWRIRLDSQTVAIAGRDGHDVTGRRRHIGLSIGVVAPRQNPAVPAQPQAVGYRASHRNEVGDLRR